MFHYTCYLIILIYAQDQVAAHINNITINVVSSTIYMHIIWEIFAILPSLKKCDAPTRLQSEK